MIPRPLHNINTHNQAQIPQIPCRTETFYNSFFPYCIKEWNKLDRKVKESVSYDQFRTSILKTIRPIQNSIFDVCDNEGIKLLTRLRLGLSHLHKHKFNHGFLDTISPMCSCNIEEETVTHYFLRCPNFTQQRIYLMNELNKIDPNLLLVNENLLLLTLLYGNTQFNDDLNSRILLLTIEFIHSSKRFDEPLFQ